MPPTESIKIVIHLQRRRDGGLRVWSDDVPGLVLSHSDAERVLSDIIPAVETIMTEALGYTVRASELVSARTILTHATRPASPGARLRDRLIHLLSGDQETREYAAAPFPA